MTTPGRLYSIEEEATDIRTGIEHLAADFKALSKKEQRRTRNEIITARKYAIDMQYTKYEAALIHEAQATDFGAKAASLALGTTAGFVPVAHTSRMLAGIGTGVSSLDTAYNEKVLRAQLVQSVLSSMRTARHERAAVIYANMRCSIKTYPIAMALSDLESYYRAGTFHAGLIKLSQTVDREETNAAATAEAQKPGGADAQARLAGLAREAEVRADAAEDRQKKKGKHKCTPEDFRDE